MVTQPGAALSGELDVPEKKQTSLGLYVTAHEAYDRWKADPDTVNIVDVRTPEEYIFVGHAAMARNIPLIFIQYQWDLEKGEPVVSPNPDFVPTIKARYGADDILLMMCRSGGRSALSVNALSQAGFTNVFNVIDGFEGDVVAEAGSLYLGKRMKNGWKNSGSPWTYEVEDADLLWTV